MFTACMHTGKLRYSHLFNLLYELHPYGCQLVTYFTKIIAFMMEISNILCDFMRLFPCSAIRLSGDFSL